MFRLAPYLAFVPAFLVWSVIPLGGDFRDGKRRHRHWFGVPTRVQLADPPIGILLVLAVSSIAVYGIMLAGWSSGSKYPLLGSVRATAQMISYEAALGLSLAAVLLSAGTLSTAGIVAGQDTLSNWNIVATGVVPFIIFMIAVTAELNRPPFDLVEAEQELVGRVQHRVLEHPLRPVLPRRVHGHDHDERRHRHAVPRRPAADRVRRHDARHPRASPAVSRARSGSSSRCCCSSTSTCGSAPRCRGCATTS